MIVKLPIIYPITDTGLSGLGHAEQVRAFAAGGATLVQIREKHSESGRFLADAVEAVEAARAAGVTLLINDRTDIAMMTNGAGVHLGQDDLPPEAARALLGTDAIIGYSTHNVRQAVAAASRPVDYIAIGPIFETSTKVDPDPVIGLDGLRAVRQAIGDFPLVAIGGITPNTLTQVIDAGADSAAMISALLDEPERIAHRYRELTNIVVNR